MSENKELAIVPKKELDSSKQKDSGKVVEYSTFENFDENTHRVRRNLLIFSVIALFYKLSGAKLNNESSFLGLQFKNVNPGWIDLFLLWIVIYHLIHFVWLAFEHYQHNIISLTRVGQKDVKGSLGFGGEGKISLKDDTWNLYLWWKKIYPASEEDSNKMNVLSNERENIDEIVKKIYSYINGESQVLNKDYIPNQVERIKSSLNEIDKWCKDIGNTISKSLDKFNNSYKNYSLTNRWRWLVLETGIPVLMGLSALYPEILKFLIRVI